MKIELTDEQMNKLRMDEWIEVSHKNSGFKIYAEVNKDGGFEYGEYFQPKQNAYNFAFDRDDIERLKPRKPNTGSWYHKDPLCPYCQTSLIYKFEYCPRCGQKIDYSESNET